jgi:hypothetical protein
MPTQYIAPGVTGVLLPDGVWYTVDPGTAEFAEFENWIDSADESQGVSEGFVFSSTGVEYRVPFSSVLAARVNPP